MLEARDIAVSYGSKQALRGVSARFSPGKLTALVGPNGCGKSSFLKAAMGFLPPQSGGFSLDGTPLASMSRRARARRIAYLPQEAHCPDYMTLGELVEMAGYAQYSMVTGPTDQDRARFQRALAQMGLEDVAGQPVNALSGGQRQRAWIAMVLAQEADILLLDEPVNHLDMKFQYAVMRVLQRFSAEAGKTVIAVMHDLSLAAAFADELLMMRDGQIHAAGPVAEVLSAQSIADVFDIEAEVFQHGERLICLPLSETDPKAGLATR